MANQKAFYNESERLKELGQEIRVNTSIASGSLVILDGEAVVISDDYMGIQFLPENIKTTEQALSFINSATD